MKFLEKLVNWARIKSPWIIHFNTGACNACDIEIVASLTPKFDVERFGVIIRGTPRHADVLVCSGPVSRQIKDRLIRIYEQMPEPKFVVAVGTCACSGGVFSGCYNIEGGIDSVIPVSAYIPGCPARPEAIIDGVVKLLASLENPAPAKPPVLGEEYEDEHEEEEAAPYLEVEITQKTAETEPKPEKPAAVETDKAKEEEKQAEKVIEPEKPQAEKTDAKPQDEEHHKKHVKIDKIEAPWEKPKTTEAKPDENTEVKKPEPKPESDQEAANG